MELFELRLQATLILRMRRLLIRGFLQQVLEDKEGEAKSHTEFSHLYQGLSPLVKLQLEKRISEPAIRKVRREGILAQNGK